MFEEAAQIEVGNIWVFSKHLNSVQTRKHLIHEKFSYEFINIGFSLQIVIWSKCLKLFLISVEKKCSVTTKLLNVILHKNILKNVKYVQILTHPTKDNCEVAKPLMNV